MGAGSNITPWQGLDGGANFEANIPDDEAAFNAEFGERLHSSGLEFDKYGNIQVEASGRDVPAHAATFAELQLGRVLRRNIEFNRYTKPTPVQQYAIPISIAGRDIMACAQTGSGKTAAFMFPILYLLLRNGKPREQRGGRRRATPSALALGPTRELAIQIHEESVKFAFRSGLRICIAYGGADIRDQMRELERGCDILIATPGPRPSVVYIFRLRNLAARCLSHSLIPHAHAGEGINRAKMSDGAGRLVDLIERGRISLSGIIFLVLDEADRMLDMGFEPQIRRIVEGEDMPSHVQNGRATMMFSATFPKNIQRLAADFLFDYIFLAVGKVGSTTDSITQRVELIENEYKRDVLMKLLREMPCLTLVFTETKRNADALEDYLITNGARWRAAAPLCHAGNFRRLWPCAFPNQ
jgi:ATP-dependent RNA helicase DDX3X